MARHLLTDPRLAVRIEAGRVLAAVPPASLGPDDGMALRDAIGAYAAMQEANTERPESHLNLANLYAEQGDLLRAEMAYKKALQIDPRFVPAAINLADLYRAQRMDPEGERILKSVSKAAPDNAALHHALGLLYVRQKKLDEAIASLQRAAALSPDNARYAYVYGVALNSVRRVDEALQVLERGFVANPFDVDLLFMLAVLHRDNGDRDRALTYAESLVEVAPHVREFRDLLSKIRKSRAQ